jgi:hypothetical protein
MIGHLPAGHEPAILFLRAFRRRSLLAAALRLSFFAALANEAVRWLTVGTNSVFETSLPVFSVGLAVFALTLAITLGRWSAASAARRADRTLALKDRLVSYLDFSRRREIPEAVVRAQGAETEAALAAADLESAVPIRFAHYGAPFLLVLSILWPSFLSGSPGRPPAIFQPGSQSSLRLVDNPSLPPAEPAHLSPGGEDRKIEKTAELEGSLKSSTGEDEKVAPPLAGLDSTQEEQEPSARRTGSAPESSVERDTPPESQRVGDRLSPVVDPLYTPGVGGGAPAPELPGGSMTFPLLPETADGGGASGSPSAAGDGTGGLVVDFDSLPEKYRLIVERYFLLLAGEGSQTGRQEQHRRSRSGAGK